MEYVADEDFDESDVSDIEDMNGQTDPSDEKEDVKSSSDQETTTGKGKGKDNKKVLSPKKFCLCLVGWFLTVLVNYLVILRTGPKTERLTILRAATHETELGDHEFCV